MAGIKLPKNELATEHLLIKKGQMVRFKKIAKGKRNSDVFENMLSLYEKR